MLKDSPVVLLIHNGRICLVVFSDSVSLTIGIFPLKKYSMPRSKSELEVYSSLTKPK